MLDILYGLQGCEKYYMQYSKVPEPVKGVGLIPLAETVQVPKFINDIAPALIAKTHKQPYRGYYRLALRDIKGNPLGVTAMWVDVDTKNNDPQYINTKIEELQLPPSFVIWSGGGYHIYWLLDKPCFDKPLINSVLGELCSLFGADTQQASIDGGLRLIGSLNWKYDHNPEVVIIMDNKDGEGNFLRYKITDFPVKEIKRWTPKDIDNPVSIFLKYFPEENPNAKTWKVSCPFHSDSDPSLAIDLEKGVWYCFSEKHEGGKGGSAVSFYSLMEGIPIKAAKKEIGTQGDPYVAAIYVVEEELKKVLEPLYTEGDGLVVTRRDDHKMFKIPMTSGTKMQFELAKALGESPIQLFTELMPIELKISVKKLEDIIRDACLNLVGKGLPDAESMSFLGQGIHHIDIETSGQVDHKTVLIDGNQFKTYTKVGFDTEKQLGWKTMSHRPVYGKYLVREAESWYPVWDPAWKMEKPDELFKRLYDGLGESWSWRGETDALTVALYTMYAPYHTWFNKPLVLYIHGPSESGKSALAEGWFAGQRRGSTGMVAGAQYIRSTSLAGLYQGMRDRSQLLVLDEIGDQTNFHSKQIMEAMRNLEANDYSIYRGTPEGRTIRYRLRMPIVWASIATPHLEQDINRIIEIQTKRERGLEDPWMVLHRIWGKDDLSRIRSCNIRSLLPYREKLMESLDKVRDIVYNGGKIAYRRAEIMMPLLAIAHMIGLDIPSILNSTRKSYEESVENLIDASPYEQLREIILTAEIPWPNTSDMKSTMMERITQGGTFENPTIGIFYDSQKNTLGIVPLSYQTFVNREYRLGYRGYQLGKMLAQLPGYLGAGQTRIGGRSVRAHVFDANKLMLGESYSQVRDPSNGAFEN